MESPRDLRAGFAINTKNKPIPIIPKAMYGDFEKWDGNLIYDFTFEGNDECDSANGDGWMKINEDRTAEGEIRFHAGDKSKFWAKKKRSG